MSKKMSLKPFICITIGVGMLLLPVLGTAGEGRAKMSLYGGKSGEVDFNHHLHQAVVEDCSVCHKDFPQEKGALEATKKIGQLKKKQVMNDTCLKCHRAKKKAGEKTGPVSCKQCHKK
ncbi:MAG TPA: cytochrome C [Desulfobacteraceae bacterium]|nr:cytochrome C [Desulfobacteraceae bacterium]|tara:strand:- start:194 stop:547 length:354 start_codon:yes stop_codon:yes gene_type:complete